MNELMNVASDIFKDYVASFKGLTPEQEINFTIKKEHSLRVAGYSRHIAETQNLGDENVQIAYVTGLFHDIGRFSQLVKYNTFNDSVSVDHAELSVEVLQKQKIPEKLSITDTDVIFRSILQHNKFELNKKAPERELLHSSILRDADKLDILQVLTDYYTNKNAAPNRTLTWELPKGTKISEGVASDILSGKLVSKKEVQSELDVKVMQLSWVYDINYKYTFRVILEKRFLEKIYSTLPKNDLIIGIYRKIKVYSENKLLT